MIKSLETRYAGCHFRSRLEARWAVFMDALEIPWVYELEGVELPSGTRYLPDFWLPSIKVWLEVKAQLRPTDVKWEEFHNVINGDEKEWQWCLYSGSPRPMQIRGEFPERTFMIASPPPPVINVFGSTACMLGPGSPHSGWSWGSCPECESIDIGHIAWEVDLHCRHYVEINVDDPRIHAAYRAARSARFEFGKLGAT